MITLNIPHASLFIPKDIKFSLSERDLEKEAILMSDTYVEQLFDKHNYIDVIQADVSRIVVDTERFIDDEIEEAAKYGMGVIYVKTHDGRKLRNDLTKYERMQLLNRFYFPYHNKLNKSVENNLNHYGKAIIIDLHSYPSNVDILGIGNKKAPDICIGFDKFHYDYDVVNILISFCQKNNFSYEFNIPFSGSIVPMQYYKKNEKVVSFMLEIKKSLYMDEDTFEKNNDFNNLKQKINTLLNDIYTKFYGE